MVLVRKSTAPSLPKSTPPAGSGTAALGPATEFPTNVQFTM
jgi:hypothetical protein